MGAQTAESERPGSGTRWDGEPPVDLDEWQEVVEGGLVIEDEELAVDSPTIGAVRVPFPSGFYTARVSGRGFTARGDTPSTKPGDVWRVQLWTPNRTRRLRTWIQGDRA